MENEGQGQTQARSQVHRPSSAPRNAVTHVPLRKGGRAFLWRKWSEPSARDDRRSHDSDRRGEHQYPGDENRRDWAPSDRDDLKKRMREVKGASFRS